MKMLIVEDDFTSRLLLQEILKAYGEPHVAVNGREAIEAVKIALDAGEPYNLICLDIMMPEVNGQEALLEIRALEEAANMDSADKSKVLMTTALADAKNVSLAYYNLCDAYLNKPLQKLKLLEALREMALIE